MKYTLFSSLLTSLLIIQTAHSATAKNPTPIRQAQPQETINPALPYLQQLQASPFPTAQKQSIINAWNSLYQVVQARNAISANNTLTAQQIATMAPLFEMNHWANFQNILNPKTFPQLTNDPEGLIHSNYATFHLNKAVARLESVSSIAYNNGAPMVNFSGDNRDLGIIVNIQNNSDAQFSIYQTSLDGKTTSQIGQLNPGLNAVNLHTAALQNPAPQNVATQNLAKQNLTMPQAATASQTNYSFEFYELNAQNPTTISIRIMNGTQLIAFLKTLPRDKKAIEKDTFEMNGLPTSPEYLANPNDWYLMLIQNPTPANSPERNPSQRIQAINISKLTGPYLLTMQINPATVEVKPTTAQAPATTVDIYQPSITTALILKNKFITTQNFPFIILPQFLWNLPTMQLNWMLLNTTYLAALTNLKMFEQNTFGNAFEYFNQLGCFNMSNKYVFFIDLYNMLKINTTLYDASWLLSTVIYETNLICCYDIPQIHPTQNTENNITANGIDGFYFNFQMILNPQITQTITADLFQKILFNNIYALPQYQLYTFIFSIKTEDIKEGILGDLIEIRPNLYQITLMNKQNQILNKQLLYIKAPIAKIETMFFNSSSNWIGSYFPIDLITLNSESIKHFKLTYEFNASNNKHILLTLPASPIDKLQIIHTVEFSTYPLTELYYDVYKMFDVNPYTRCFIIKDGIMPSILTTLTEQDWKSGIYLVPSINNNDKLSNSNPGALTITFYKSDKKLLGEFTTKGQFNNTNIEGIRETAQAYNLYCKQFRPLRYIFLSTGILLKYNPIYTPEP